MIPFKAVIVSPLETHTTLLLTSTFALIFPLAKQA